jgi:hypothetical protein
MLCAPAMRWSWSATTITRCSRRRAIRHHSSTRIGGRFGHLENEQAAALLRQIDTAALQHLVLAAHLSQENNRPELAARALASALGCSEDWIGVADQEAGSTGGSCVDPSPKKKPARAGFFL